MIKQVTITNYHGDSVVYKIEGVDVYNNNGLLITEIDGLGPVKADINFTKLATYDGQMYNSAQLEGRNIKIKALFLEAKTIEEARLSSYKFFPIKRRITFDILTDNRKAYVSGYVESNEPDIFSDSCEMDISVECESSFFYDANGINEQMFSNVNPLFEFVYENSSPTEKLTEMGEIINRRQCLVTYAGDADTGFEMIFHAIGEVRNITMYHIDSGESIRLDTNKLLAKTGKAFDDGDDIIVTTTPGQKSIKLLRNGEYTNMLNIAGKDPKWFKLMPGTNTFTYTTDYGEQNLRVYVRAHPLFDGV